MKQQQLEHYSCYINGEWIDALNGDKTEVENPATNCAFATVPNMSTKEAELALVCAQNAEKDWRDLPAIQRADYLFKMIESLVKKRDLFAKLLVLEQGKTLAEAYGEFDDTINYLRYSAEAARRIEGQIFPSDNSDEQLWIQKVPYGVVVALCAFNYPLALIGRKLGPALVTGNTVVLKPHEATPITAMEFCKTLDEIGLPAGVVNVITGGGAKVGAYLSASPITKLVTVTGSIRAGQEITRSSADNITALSLELGGKASFIVLEDADIDAAVEAAVISRYANCGQVCICNELVLVHEKIADEFTRKVIERVKQIRVGDPMSDVNMGPSVTQGGLQRVYDIVEKTLAEGATLALGGKRPDGEKFKHGNWIEPTVLTDVSADMTAAKEEIFGPVMPIVTISSYEQALEITNRRNDGLSAYIYTQNYKTFMHAIKNVEVGTLFINKQIVGYIQGYHSGHKRSGVGGEDGIYGIEGYLQKRTVYLNCN
ncbi:aldehyde dehydrogenase family protein [Alginatibacterium sediminis]|uniref:Aldehyde dehydrogenase family protein n=1 Tax=Alginatibacterium sediminis TaxID=2164068 RepID=A0A420EB67_9ALTE|nr:aldehyde dehydrogenase family protein [Alginatibacterium sediminis]RKF17939.1 aldehyde dehydrogenase family protein [Alginatibacterium sediminis]